MSSSSTQAAPPLSVLQKLCGDAVVKGGGVKLTDVNPHLVCVLCHGYFVDATSIVECLHSFCRSCIVLHLDKNSYCPICREDIQNSKALKPDKALQDIVYKLVPGLFHSEMNRRQEFYQKHPHRDMHLHPEFRGISVDRIVYTADEQISLSLEYYDKECEQEMWKNVTDDKGLHYIVRTDKQQRNIIRKRYLKCPAAVRMSHLKKFIRLKYNLKSSDFVELIYRRESLPESYSVMDIAYIYTWNRNEPMRFFYKINASVTVPVIPPVATGKRLTTSTDVITSVHEKRLQLNSDMEMMPLPPQVKLTDFNHIFDPVKDDKTKLLKLSVTDESVEKQLPKTDRILTKPMVNKQDLRPSSTPPTTVPIVPLNPPISPEGTSRKENVSDNVRNSCANEMAKLTPAMSAEEKKSVDPAEQQQANNNNTINVPMKKLEKLVDQQKQQTLSVPTVTSADTVTATAASVSSPSTLPNQKKSGESKLNLSISKLIMKTQNAAAAAASKFVPTLQQMQQIGMHTSIPSFQQQQTSSPQPNAYARPGFPGIYPFKRTPDVLPVRNQAPTNRPPFIPVRKSYEWNKARNLAAKPLQSPAAAAANAAATAAANAAATASVAAKDNKTNEKLTTMTEKSTKKTIVEKPPTTPVTNGNMCMPPKNSDEMNAAQSLLKVGQDLRMLKSPTIANLHDKYNCESSLQITKVTDTETVQSPTVSEKRSSSQPSLQIMRVPTASTDRPTKQPPPVTTQDTTGGSHNGNGCAAVVTNKPVNKKPVPSLYSMPMKRMKETTDPLPKRMKETESLPKRMIDDSTPPPNGVVIADKRKERHVDTENGVLSVSLLTESNKQDMDAKRREVVQPDVSIKLMTFATEPPKKTPELNPIGGNSAGSMNQNSNKRKMQDDPNSSPNTGGSASKRKQDEPERKVTPPKLAPTKDDVPQLIEINSSPYAKLLPAKKQQLLPKQLPAPKQQQSSLKQQQSGPKHQQSGSKQQLPVPVHKSSQSTPKQQSKVPQAGATNVLDLSRSPPNGGLKRNVVATDGSSAGSSPNKTKPASPSPVQFAPSSMAAATSAATAAINSNLLFAAQRQAAAFLLKQHFETLNNGLMRNGGRGPAEWPRALFNPAMFARPPTNLNN